MAKKFFVKRIGLWLKIRWKIWKVIRDDGTAKYFIEKQKQANVDREILKTIAQHHCTGTGQDECIVRASPHIEEWCIRCLVLDHLIHNPDVGIEEFNK